MKFLTHLLLPLGATAAAAASIGASCAAPSPTAQGPTNITITSNNLQRSFLLWVPPTYNSKAPTSVILSYHGGTKTAQEQLGLDGFTDPWFKTTSIVVYPQGIDDKWQGVPGVTVNDVQFTSDMLDYVQKKYNVDKARIYATGKSDGAGFCNVLACDAHLSKRIAAFAPVSGAFYVDTTPCHADTVQIPCSAGRTNIPFLEFHGGNDTTVNYQGGDRKNECLPSIPHFIQQWAIRDGLGAHNTSTPLTADTTWYKFGHGASAGLVEHIFDATIGHDWPSTVLNDDNSKPGHHVASFNATPIILDFFGKYHF